MSEALLQLGISGVTVIVLLWLFSQLRADVKEQIAKNREDAKWNAEQLIKIIDQCMEDDDQTAPIRAAIASRYDGDTTGAGE